jgi:hypothetical protein
MSLIDWLKFSVKCDSASNAAKSSLNNGVSIVEKLGKLSNTSTMLFASVAKTKRRRSVSEFDNKFLNVCYAVV